MSIEAVKAFYKRLSSDEIFYRKLKSSKTKAECQAIVRAAGYDFTQAELADYTSNLFEVNSEMREPNTLNSKELEAVTGGAIAFLASTPVMPPYGHVPFEL
jgi:predicted ribosomally synthesized peptide with nif11-like leader